MLTMWARTTCTTYSCTNISEVNYLHLFTDCFMKISPLSSKLIQFCTDKLTSEIIVHKALQWALYHVWFQYIAELTYSYIPLPVFLQDVDAVQQEGIPSYSCGHVSGVFPALDTPPPLLCLMPPSMVLCYVRPPEAKYRYPNNTNTKWLDNTMESLLTFTNTKWLDIMESLLTFKVLVTTIDALQYFETG